MKCPAVKSSKDTYLTVLRMTIYHDEFCVFSSDLINCISPSWQFSLLARNTPPHLSFAGTVYHMSNTQIYVLSSEGTVYRIRKYTDIDVVSLTTMAQQANMCNFSSVSC